MQAEKLANMLSDVDVDIKVVHAIRSLAHSINFHDTYFVSSAGDNSDGLSWDTAYTSLSSVMTDIASNQASSGQLDVVFLGVGSHDLSRTTAITDNIFFIGSGKHLTTITNTGSGTAEVIKSTGILGLFNLTVDIGATAIEGIYISGTSANGSVISNIFIDCDAASGAQSAIYLDDSVQYIQISNVKIEGVAANTTAVHFNDANKCNLKDVKIDTALIGIHLDHADDDSNEFDKILIDSATTGIQIDNAGSTGNRFSDVEFVGCTTNINDSGTSTTFIDVEVKPKGAASLAPADLTGQVITAAAGANNWTAAAVQIRSAAAATKPFYVTGLVFEPDTAEKWGVRLYDDGGTTPFWDGILEAVANRSNRISFQNRFLISQGTAIHGTVKSETGGNNMDIWINIEEI
jgi:hypothetical protein